VPREKGNLLSQERGFSAPVDLIRTVAIVAVILLHSANDLTIQQMNQFEIIRWTTVDLYQSLGRIGVPLFLLLTGALLLQPSKLNEPIKVFFKKRVSRIGLAFVFWGAVYFAWDFLVVHKINSQPITTNSIVQGILTGPYYHFWYLYLLLGLYLLTPIMRVIVAHADRNLIKYLLVVWFLGAAVLPVFTLVTTLHIDSNVFILAGYIGYFFLGIYLMAVTMRRSTAAILFAIAIALTSIGTYLIAWTIGGGTMFFFQEYLSPTMILAAVSMFLLLCTYKEPACTSPVTPVASVTPTVVPALAAQQTTPVQKPKSHQSPGRKLMHAISVNTLPLYLFHVMVLETIQYGFLGFAFNGNVMNSIVEVPLMTTIVLFISLGIILVMKKVPILNKLIG
jgi:surface polysaccharide O-acyltransferase-like enzyme